MDLDLSQQLLVDPSDTSVVEFDPALESDRGHIHDRIRHLEAVTSRARQRLRCPPVHPPIQLTNFTGEAATADAQDEGRDRPGAEEGIVESPKGDHKKGVHLIAKALGVETDAGKEKRSAVTLFDCNICFDIARDPVLTCCGHLFCWPCFYQLSYAYYTVKECPVCRGDVSETGIIPIYGNSNASSNCQLEIKQAGLMFPPRPRAHRVDSMRQRLISQRASSSAIQNIRRYHNLMGGLGEPVQPQSPNSASDRNTQHAGSDEISRLIEGADSFPSFTSVVNSAMDSAERLVQDLELHYHGYHTRGNRRLNRRAANGSSTSSGNVAAGSASRLNRNVGTTAVIGSEMQTTDSNAQTNPQDSSSYSRRRNASRPVSNETRRRRRRT